MISLSLFFGVLLGKEPFKISLIEFYGFCFRFERFGQSMIRISFFMIPQLVIANT